MHISISFSFYQDAKWAEEKIARIKDYQLEKLLREHNLVVTGSKIELIACLLQANPDIVKYRGSLCKTFGRYSSRKFYK